MFKFCSRYQIDNLNLKENQQHNGFTFFFSSFNTYRDIAVLNAIALPTAITIGNVLYIEEDIRIPADAGSGGAKTTEGKEIPLCFIKYLLGGYVVIAGIGDTDLRPECSTDPHKTSVLLIDFNHAELLESMEDSQ